MYLRMAKRMMLETDKRLLWKIAWNFGWKGGIRAVQKHKKRMKKGEFFPPFLYISMINSCNLQCQGCWVDVKARQHKIERERFSKMIHEAKAMGNYFFGILGGEPFMYKGLLDVLSDHPDCYFQIFTNGQLITKDIAKRMHELGNITPLISVEGSNEVVDERRGGSDVNNKTFQGIKNCIDHKLFTGVCTSICKTNFDDMVRESWCDQLIDLGVMYMWFHTYRPIGPDPSEDLALSPEQQRQTRQFVVDMRAKKPIAFIDAYYDHQGKALCPAATGISHHISPYGDIEPCPIIQFAKEKIDDERGLKTAFLESAFLKDFRDLAAANTRGCIVLDHPDKLKALAEKHDAADTTIRNSAYEELGALTPKQSQYSPGEEIPEKSFAYKLAKRFFYNDFGVYKKWGL